MDGVQFQMGAVKALADDLGRVKSRLMPAMRAVTARGALNIKNDAQASIRAQTRHIFVKQYPNSITYDITKSSGTEVRAEIGPDKDKPQGALGNLLEFGSPSHNAPMPHLVPAFEAEAPTYAEQLGIAASNAVLGP